MNQIIERGFVKRMIKKSMILQLLVILMLLVNVSICNAFSDIEDPELENAAATLERFGVISGYPDGSFGTDKPITRAEFARVIVAVTNNSGVAYEESNFSDVKDTNWAKAYINIAKTLGIVSGTSKNTFSPSGKITYQQAVKMIVSGIGYDEEAITAGGYPQGYIKVANDLGILDGIEYRASDEATRGDIALMLQKVLKVPFYFIYSDGKSIVRERSEFTLYEIHEWALNGEDRLNVVEQGTDEVGTVEELQEVG